MPGRQVRAMLRRERGARTTDDDTATMLSRPAMVVHAAPWRGRSDMNFPEFLRQASHGRQMHGWGVMESSFPDFICTTEREKSG